MLHRETSAYTTAYRRPAVYFYVTDFPIMYNCNIVCNKKYTPHTKILL